MEKYWAVQKNTLDILECIHPLQQPYNWVTFKTVEEAEQYVSENKSYNIDFSKPLNVNFISLHNKYYPNEKIYTQSEVDAIREEAIKGKDRW
ncbi:MAG: hypothetical protein V4547_09595 [Bacteroidota bacterium]